MEARIQTGPARPLLTTCPFSGVTHSVVIPGQRSHPIDDRLDGDRLRRLIDVGRGLLSPLEPEAVLDQVLETAREITGARYAALGILDP